MANSTKFAVLTFDCYGTLVDWESGIREVFAKLASVYAPSADLDALLTRWEAIQFDRISGPYRSYRVILRESLVAAWHECGVALDGSEANLLADCLVGWHPFEDSVRSLKRLGQEYRLAILSNIDDDLLAGTVARLGVEFDALITAEQLRSYKPRPGHFREALRRFAVRPEQILHVAFGFKYDQRPALDLGMSTAWIKRAGWIRDDDAEPTYEFDNLDQLTAFLAAD